MQAVMDDVLNKHAPVGTPARHFKDMQDFIDRVKEEIAKDRAVAEAAIRIQKKGQHIDRPKSSSKPPYRDQSRQHSQAMHLDDFIPSDNLVPTESYDDFGEFGVPKSQVDHDDDGPHPLHIMQRPSFAKNPAPGGDKPTHKEKSACSQFAQSGACKFGDKCRYPHERQKDFPVRNDEDEQEAKNTRPREEPDAEGTGYVAIPLLCRFRCLKDPRQGRLAHGAPINFEGYKAQRNSC